VKYENPVEADECNCVCVWSGGWMVFQRSTSVTTDLFTNTRWTGWVTYWLISSEQMSVTKNTEPNYDGDLVEMNPNVTYSWGHIIAARAWNSLPSSLRAVQSLTTFRHCLKTELFDCSFTWLSYCTINMCVFSLILYSALATAIAVSRYYNHSLV